VDLSTPLFNLRMLTGTLWYLPPPQAFQKNKIGGKRTERPADKIFQNGGSHKPNYICIHFTRTILLLKSLAISDIDRFSYPQYT
jgi:hypothetical protein